MKELDEIRTRIEHAKRVTYTAHWIGKDGCGDDWDLIRADHRQVFDNESEANEFIKDKFHKGKQDYWQPHVIKHQHNDIPENSRTDMDRMERALRVLVNVVKTFHDQEDWPRPSRTRGMALASFEKAKAIMRGEDG